MARYNALFFLRNAGCLRYLERLACNSSTGFAQYEKNPRDE